MQQEETFRTKALLVLWQENVVIAIERILNILIAAVTISIDVEIQLPSLEEFQIFYS